MRSHRRGHDVRNHSMPKIHVLVVEDAPDLRLELVDYLQFKGYHAEGVGSIGAMQASLRAAPWHVVVLDLGLPDGDGMDAARWVRAHSGQSVGLVMATARGRLDDRIDGLGAGADAYLVKPVEPRELQAVIERLASRLSGTGWRIAPGSRQLLAPNGLAVPLTGAEALVLERLLAVRPHKLTREELNAVLGPGGDPGDTRRLDTLISRLRSKVQAETQLALPVQTFRNQGFAFAQ